MKTFVSIQTAMIDRLIACLHTSKLEMTNIFI